jgi:hypothetical protein
VTSRTGRARIDLDDSTTAANGARSPIRVATAPELESVSGRFFGPRGKELTLPEQAGDEETRRRLSELSGRLVELTPGSG